MTIHAPSDFWRKHSKGLAIRSSNLSSHRNYWCSYALQTVFQVCLFQHQVPSQSFPKIIRLAEQTTALDFQIGAKEGLSSYRKAAL